MLLDGRERDGCTTVLLGEERLYCWMGERRMAVRLCYWMGERRMAVRLCYWVKSDCTAGWESEGWLYDCAAR